MDVSSDGGWGENAIRRCGEPQGITACRASLAAVVRWVGARGSRPVYPVSAAVTDLASRLRRRRGLVAGVGDAPRQRPTAWLVARGRYIFHHRASRVHAGGIGTRAAPGRGAHLLGVDLHVACPAGGHAGQGPGSWPRWHRPRPAGRGNNVVARDSAWHKRPARGAGPHRYRSSNPAGSAAPRPGRGVETTL